MQLSPGREGTTVRLTLTDAGTAHLATVLGPGAASVAGRVTSVTDSGVTLGVTRVTRLTGVGEAWKGEAVTVPRADVASAAHEEVSVPRSILAAGAVVAGAVLAARVIGGSVTGGSGRSPTGQPH